MMKKYFVEGLGAFLLTLVVSLSLAGQFPVATPILAGLTLGLFVYTAGWLSGAHINPAVTVGVWSIGKISAKDAAFYIVAQFIGAGVAYYLSRTLVGPLNITATDTGLIGLAEFLGTVFFAFGIAAVIHGKVPEAFSGAVVGGSLLLGLSIAASASNAIINPAVALGLGSFSYSYVLMPVVGSIVGMQLFKWLAK